VLELSHSRKLTDEGLHHVSLLPSLEEFCLTHCPHITTKGFEELAKVKTIKRLTFAYIRIDDRKLMDISRLFPGLEQLWLYGCDEVTDKGLDQLGTMKALQRLHVDTSEHTTLEGLAKLRASLPRCDVMHYKQEEEVPEAVKVFSEKTLTPAQRREWKRARSRLMKIMAIAGMPSVKDAAWVDVYPGGWQQCSGEPSKWVHYDGWLLEDGDASFEVLHADLARQVYPKPKKQRGTPSERRSTDTPRPPENVSIDPGAMEDDPTLSAFPLYVKADFEAYVRAVLSRKGSVGAQPMDGGFSLHSEYDEVMSVYEAPEDRLLILSWACDSKGLTDQATVLYQYARHSFSSRGRSGDEPENLIGYFSREVGTKLRYQLITQLAGGKNRRELVPLAVAITKLPGISDEVDREAADLARHLKSMASDDEKRAGKAPVVIEGIPVQERIEELVYHLRNVHARQFSQPAFQEALTRWYFKNDSFSAATSEVERSMDDGVTLNVHLEPGWVHLEVAGTSYSCRATEDRKQLHCVAGAGSGEFDEFRKGLSGISSAMERSYEKTLYMRFTANRKAGN